MFRPLSVLASRIPSALFWSVEPNLMAEPFLNREKRQQLQTQFYTVQSKLISSLLTVPKVKKIE